MNFHYCSWTKHKVKEKVRRNVELELGMLDKAPQAGGASQAETGVIVPALV